MKIIFENQEIERLLKKGLKSVVPSLNDNDRLEVSLVKISEEGGDKVVVSNLALKDVQNIEEKARNQCTKTYDKDLKEYEIELNLTNILIDILNDGVSLAGFGVGTRVKDFILTSENERFSLEVLFYNRDRILENAMTGYSLKYSIKESYRETGKGYMIISQRGMIKSFFHAFKNEIIDKERVPELTDEKITEIVNKFDLDISFLYKSIQIISSQLGNIKDIIENTYKYIPIFLSKKVEPFDNLEGKEERDCRFVYRLYIADMKVPMFEYKSSISVDMPF